MQLVLLPHYYVSVMLELLNTGNWKVRRRSKVQWNFVHTEFHERCFCNVSVCNDQ
jgi:hypothetical protein